MTLRKKYAPAPCRGIFVALHLQDADARLIIHFPFEMNLQAAKMSIGPRPE